MDGERSCPALHLALHREVVCAGARRTPAISWNNVTMCDGRQERVERIVYDHFAAEQCQNTLQAEQSPVLGALPRNCARRPRGGQGLPASEERAGACAAADPAGQAGTWGLVCITPGLVRKRENGIIWLLRSRLTCSIIRPTLEHGLDNVDSS